jgi:DNA-binding NtrC family response regulator
VKKETITSNRQGSLMMKPKFSVLLAHYRNDRFGTLNPILEALSMKVIQVRSLKEAEATLCEIPCPHLVLTDAALPDGNWMDVLDIAAKAVEPVNVIVISPVADIKLYLDAMDHGAFDFMTDSFTVPEIVHILKCALDNVARRRRARVVDCAPVSVEAPQIGL